MPRRRSRRRSKSHTADSGTSDATQPLGVDDLSPRARRLVESGVIDLDAIAGSGENGKITSGDILHAARLMEMEQSVPRIERLTVADTVDSDESAAPQEPVAEEPSTPGELIEVFEAPTEVEVADSGTSTAAQVGGQPISVAPDPWDAYNGSSDGLAESAMPGAEQSWGEAEANIAAIAEEAASQEDESTNVIDEVPAEVNPDGADSVEDEPGVIDEPDAVEEEHTPENTADADSADASRELEEEPSVPAESIADLVAAANEAIATTSVEPDASGEQIPAPTSEAAVDEVTTEHSDVMEEAVSAPLVPPSRGEVMMDFGTLELVDPDSVWAEGAEDFAPWFLAHSQQLGDVLGLEAGLSNARQFTTKSATGVVGSDDNGEEVVVVSSKSATADDSDLGRALGMAASSGAASVALVSAALGEDQLKALAWLNNQTKSGVKWYGIEMRVVRIAESPAAMLFELVASPPQEHSPPQEQ